MLDTHARSFVQPVIERAARHLSAWGVTPNAATSVAFATGLFAAAAFGLAFPKTALVLLWLSGFLDTVDGTLARLTGRTSPLGTLFDLVADRVVEVAFIVAAALRVPDSRLACVFLLGSIVFSFSVFLIVGMLSEKQGEKSFYYQAGLAERTETFLIFSAAIVLPDRVSFIFYLFAAAIIFTGAQRLREACVRLGPPRKERLR